nr:putative ribonuclease H-like domain-containing protein [Tanacetum cinerariifolium]
MESQSETTQTVSALKLPVLKTGKYDLWSMRMKQYLTFTDHVLWEVIVNSDSVPPVTSASAGVEGPIPPKTVKQKLATKNELKAKSTLMLAIQDEHLLKFHTYKDKKSLWEVIKNRFGGNKESKKMQKTILMQNYENFAASSQEGLVKTYDRSLPSAWNNIALIMRNKSDLDTLSIDDLYNNLKVYESEIKSQSSSTSNSHNVVFVFSDNSSSTNEIVNTNHSVFTASSKDQASTASYADDVMFSFFSNQPNALQLDNEDLEQIDTDDLKEMDLKWQVAILTMRVKRRGHFARECRAPRNQGNINRDAPTRNAPMDTSTTNSLVVQDGIAKTNNFNEKVNTTKVNNVTTVGPKAVVSVVEGNRNNVVKSSACWIWRPNRNLIENISKDSRSYTLKRFNYVDPQGENLVLRGLLSKMVLLREKNRTLIEAARTMLADSKLPTTFWAEVVNTACYVQNRVLVIKPHNKTPYELFLGRKPALSFMRSFGCPVTILNTLDHLGKFDGKSDDGFFVGYSINSKAFRVFNTRTRFVEENLNINFLENKPNVAGTGPNWMFDIDTLTMSMNYQPVFAGNQTNGNAGTKANINAEQARKKKIPGLQYVLPPLLNSDSQGPKSSKDEVADDARKKSTGVPRKENGWETDATGGSVNPMINNLGDRFPRRGRALAATQTETVPANASLQARLLERGNNLIHPSVQEAIGAGQQRNNKRARYSSNHYWGPLVISYVNAAIDTTAIGFKRRRLLIKNQLVTHLTLGNTLRAILDALRKHADSKVVHAYVVLLQTCNTAVIDCSSLSKPRGQMGTREGAFISLESIYESVKGPGCIFTLTAIAKWECSSYGRALALHARGTRFDSSHFLIFSLLVGSSYVNLDGSIHVNAATLPNADLPTYLLMPDLEDTSNLQDTKIFSGVYDDEVEGVVADFNNLELITVIDVKSAFLYGTIEEEVYVCQPPGFEDPHFPNKVYKVERALYGLHQVPRSWYETLSTYLLENGFRTRIIDKTLFIKKDKGDILLVQLYVDDIIFSQDKYVADILKKFDFSSIKIASTPIETNKALLKNVEAEDVDVHLYRSIIRSLMYLIASKPNIMFVVYAYARFQVTSKVSHLHAMKKIFGYLKGQPKLSLWYPRMALVMNLELKLVVTKVSTAEKKLVLNGCLDWNETAANDEIQSYTYYRQLKDSAAKSKFTTAGNGYCCWGFEQITDFLNASYIKYALTVSPTVYTLYIEQIWATAKVKNVNGKAQIQALVDKKKGRMNEEDMFRVNDLDGDEVIVDVSSSKKVEQSVKVVEKEVSAADPVTTASEVVTTAGIEVTIAATTPQISKDELTLAETLIEIKAAKPKAITTAATTVTAASTRPKEKEIVMQEPSETPSPKPIISSQKPSQVKYKGKGKMVEPERPLKRKDQIMMDAKVAKNLEAQMQAELEEEERLARFKEEETNLALVTEWDNTQAMMDVDCELAVRLKEEERGELSIEEKLRLFVELMDKIKKHFMLFNNTMKWIEAFIPMDTELVKGSEKAVEGKLKRCLEIILEDDDDVTIKATPLSSKSSTIVDYKIYKEGRKSFFKIIRADGNSQSYLTLGKIFKNFNREDLEVLWIIVKARFKKTKPIDDMDNLLF